MSQQDRAYHNGDERNIEGDLIYYDGQGCARSRRVLDVQGHHKKDCNRESEWIPKNIGKVDVIEQEPNGQANQMSANDVPGSCRGGSGHCKQDESSGAHRAD